MAFPADDLDRLIGVPEAAARLGMHPVTAYRAIKDDTFPVRVLVVNGRKRVSLRALAEFMYGAPIEAAS